LWRRTNASRSSEVEASGTKQAFKPKLSTYYSERIPVTDAVSLLGSIRVVELGGDLAGAICGKFFADLGADVILVEPPRRGCEVRWQEPFLDNRPGVDRGGLFLYTGGGKRGLTP
jgi:hypothetical protein